MADLQLLSHTDKKDARSLVIDVLSKEWLSSAKQINASLKNCTSVPTFDVYLTAPAN